MKVLFYTFLSIKHGDFFIAYTLNDTYMVEIMKKKNRFIQTFSGAAPNVISELLKAFYFAPARHLEYKNIL